MKRFISLFLSLCMVLTMLPVQLFAEDDLLHSGSETPLETGEDTLIEDPAPTVPHRSSADPASSSDDAQTPSSPLSSSGAEQGADAIAFETPSDSEDSTPVASGEDSLIVETLAGTTVASGTCGDNLKWTLDSGGVLTISGTGAMPVFDYGGDDSPWYSYADSIKSVIIKSGVTTIGSYAFYYYYRSLTSVTLPDTLSYIGNAAFYASRLTSVMIPKNVTRIGDSAFSRIDELQTVTFLPDSALESIGSSAFLECEGLETITLPDNITTIDGSAFSGCTKLASIALPSKLTEFGSSVFSNCYALEHVTLSDRITVLPYGTFSQCTSLKSISLPEGLQEIDRYAFSGCTELGEVVFPSSLTSIGDYAFRNCTNLKTVSLPETLTTINMGAFSGCGFSEFVFPSNITSVSAYILENCTELKEVTFPAQCKEISYRVLAGCTSLTEVSLPGALEILGSSVFARTGITELVLPQSLVKIGAAAFAETNITSLSIPENVSVIDGRAFNGSMISELTIEGISPRFMLQGGALYSSDGRRFLLFLETYGDYCTVQDGVSTIEEYALHGNTAVRTLDLPASLTKIENYGLYENENLSEIVFRGSETEWNNVLMGYAVTLPETITCLGTDPVYPQDLGTQSNPVTNWAELRGAFNMASTDSSSVTKIYVSPSFSTSDDTISEKSVAGRNRYIQLIGASTEPTTIRRPGNVLGDMFRIYGGSLQLSNLILDGGSTETPVPGSIIACGERALITVDKDVILQNNNASVNGGAIRADTISNLYVYGTISNNSSTQLGGGVCMYENGWFELSGTVTQNTATSGGGLYLHSTTAYFYNSRVGGAGTISHNTAYEDGGGVYWDYGYGDFNRGIIEHNTAKRGGGMYLAASKETSLPGTIQYNSASERGGGLYMAYGAKITWNGRISDNYCSSKTIDNRDDLYIVGAAPALTMGSSRPPSDYKCYIDLGMPSVTFAYHRTYVEPWANFFISTRGLPIMHMDTEIYLLSSSSPITSTLDANGGSWGEETTKTITAGYAYKVTDMPEIPVRDGYIFLEWNTSADRSGSVFDPNAEFAMQHTSDETFYAIWLATDHVHTFSNYVSNRDATCLEDGTKTSKCDDPVCRVTDTIPDEGSALGHAAVTDAAVSATCTVDGLTEGSHCSRCNAVILAQEVIPATGIHSYTDYQSDDNATCTESGSSTAQCDYNCGSTDTIPDTVPPLGHRIAIETTIATESLTFVNNSAVPFVLTNGTYYSNNHGHGSSSQISATAAKDVTLTLRYGVSSESGYDKLYILHNGTQKAAISGLTSNKVMTLNLTVGDIVVVRYTKDGSTSSNKDRGWVTFEYVNTPTVETEDLPADTFEPDCTNAVVCSYCQTIVKPALGHTEAIDAAVAPTCEGTGLTEGTHCSVCNEVLVAQTVVNAVGHSWLVANCLAPQTCAVCGITEGGPAQNHSNLKMLTTDNNGWLLVDGAAVSPKGTLPAGNYYLGDNITIATTIKINSDVKICLNGKVLQYQSATEGSVFYVTNGALYITDCGTDLHLYDRTNTGLWVWNDEDGDHRLYGGAITGGTGRYGNDGGAVYIESGSFELHGGCLVGNTAANGGAIAGSQSYRHTVRVYDSQIIGNVANNGDGGGIYTRGLGTSDGYEEQTILFISNTRIEQNVAEDGGAIAGGGNVTLENCILRKNRATYSGGAIRATGGSLSLTDCTITENTAARNSGGIYSMPTISLSGMIRICDNTCETDGEAPNLNIASSSAVLMIVDALSEDSCIKLRQYQPESTIFTGGGGASYRSCFITDDPAYHIAASEGELCFEAHTEEIVPAVSATCTENGLTAGTKCPACDKIIVAQTEVAALGHTEAIDAAVKPTCTATGLTEGKHCSVCNEVLVAQNEVAALGHNWGEWVTITEPTETAEGEENRICTTCSELETQRIPKLEHRHKYNSAVTVPTCLNQGYTTYTCACGDSYVADYVAVKSHTEVIDAAVAPTCTETGLTEGKHCSECQQILIAQEVLSELGHTAAASVTENATAATCTVAGSYDSVAYCSVCNAELSRETIEVSATGHTEVTDEAKAPTCTESGLTAGSHCAVCDVILVAQETIPAAHTWHATEDIFSEQCSVCGETRAILFSGYCGGEGAGTNLTWTLDGSGTLTIAGEGTMANFAAAPWYEYRQYIKTLVLDARVTTIGAYAFAFCQNLTIPLPDLSNITYIGAWAFSGCSGLTGEIKLSDKLTKLEDGVFFECNKLDRVLVIPESVTELGSLFFSTTISNDCDTQVYLFEGNAPTIDSLSFPYSKAYLYILFKEGTTGWSAPTWNGINSLCWDGVVSDMPLTLDLSEGSVTMFEHEGNSYFIQGNVLCTSNSCTITQSTETTRNSILVLGGDCRLAVSQLNIQAKHPICLMHGSLALTLQELNTLKSTAAATGGIHVNESAGLTIDGNGCLISAGYDGSDPMMIHAPLLHKEAKQATCTEDGYVEHWYCTICSKYFADAEALNVLMAESVGLSATGHTEVIDAIQLPTCTESGISEGKHCSVCNAILTAQEVLPATGHKEVIDAATVPTCTETGLTEGSHCSVCNTVLTAQTVLPATGHTENPAQTVDGVYAKACVCSVCGETFQVFYDARISHMSLPQTGVTSFAVTDGTYPWLFNQESQRFESSNAGIDSSTSQLSLTFTLTDNASLSFRYGVSSEIGFDKLTITDLFGEQTTTIANAINGTQTGSYTGTLPAGTHTLTFAYVKDVMGSSVGDMGWFEDLTIAVCPHPEYATQIVAPTCSAGGYTTYTCIACGHSYTGDETPALDHTWSAVDSEFYRVCSVCSLKEQLDSISGTTEDGLSWTLDANGTLTIFGAGDCSDGSAWYAYTDRITNLVLESGITGLFEDVVYELPGLTSLSLSETVTEMDHLVLNESCPALKCITVHADNPSYSADNGVLFSKDQTILLLYPAGKSDSMYTIPASVTEIGNYAFQGCTSLTALFLPSNLEAFGARSFMGCTGLQNIVLDSSNATFTCDSNVALIRKEDRALVLYCPGSLQSSYTVPDGVVCIETRAFADAVNLKTLSLPLSLETVEQSAFTSCDNLATVHYPGTECYWGHAVDVVSKDNDALTDAAFVYGNVDTLSGTCGDNVTWTLGLTDGVLTLSGSGAMEFPKANGLLYGSYIPWPQASVRSVVIKEGITSLCLNAFAHCTALTEVTIPESVTSIERRAFDSCPIATMYYTGSEPQWGLVSVADGNISLLMAEHVFDSYLLVEWNSSHTVLSISEKVKGSAYVLAAFYDANGQMVYVKHYTADEAASGVGISSSAVDLKLCTAKVMILDENYAPIGVPYTPDTQSYLYQTAWLYATEHAYIDGGRLADAESSGSG